MALRRTVVPGARSHAELATREAHDSMLRQLAKVGGIPERTIEANVPAAGSQVLVHRLGRVPKGIAVERCDLGGPVTMSARDAETITLANAHATDAAACVVRVY
jgi:hypothetical protein